MVSTKKIEKLIASISFFRNKAKHIKECSIQLVENFNGVVPQTMEELTSLAGIGRKSANVIMLEAFNNHIDLQHIDIVHQFVLALQLLSS